MSPLINPVDQYPADAVTEQQQPAPGLDSEMTPKADHGEQSYVGSGKLTGRKALVTGADSGIGRAVAIAFAREGADVVLGYLAAEQSDAEEVAALVTAAGRRAVLAPGDLAVESEARRLVTTAVHELGGLDIVVNVAGKQQFVDDLADLDPEQFDQTFKTNVYSLFWVVQEALPHLPAGAAIINTSSIQAYSPSPGLVDYASTKAAINTMSKSLAQQLAPKGIRVNVVAPGPVWTRCRSRGPADREAVELRPGHPARARRPARRDGRRLRLPRLPRVGLRHRRDPERQRRDAHP